MNYKNNHIGCIGKNCPHCEKFDADPEKYAQVIRVLMGEEIPDPPKLVIGKAVFPPDRTDCVYMGEFLELVDCPSCPNKGRTKAKVFSCKKRGPCTPFAYAVPFTVDCNSCDQYTPKEKENGGTG